MGKIDPWKKEYYARKAREYRARAKEKGLCPFGISHGPATHGVLCEKCHEKHLAKERIREASVTKEKKKHRAEIARKSHERRKEAGFCAIAKSHGKATRGLVCKACFKKRKTSKENKDQRKAYREKRKDRVNALRRASRARKKIVVTCMMGAHHGPAEDGKWCAACIERRKAAAERLAKRNKTKSA